MLSIEENERLTQVGPGTPGGELMRRYWHPVAAAAELSEAHPTKAVRILGEDLVLYRDRSGDIGLIGQRCAHRRVSLVYGVPEEHGLRCQYHGWMYDATGQCIEQPFEETVNPEARFKEKVRLAGYPVQEAHGLIFAYLGPEPAPLLPRWAPMVWDNTVHDIAITLLPCNWLQCQENSLDPVHLEWLHGYYGAYTRAEAGVASPFDNGQGPVFPPRRQNRHQKIQFDLFKYGIIKRRIYQGGSEEDDDWKHGHPIMFPNVLLVGSPQHATLQFRVPIDDSHTYHVSIYTWRAAPGHSAPRQDVVPYRYVQLRDDNGEFAHQVYTFNQDYMAWATQGPVAERDQERLGESDTGIILFRRLLQEQTDLVLDGGEPLNVFREPGSEIIEDLPLEKVRFGSGGRRWLRYFPQESGETSAVADIEAVLETYTEPELVAR